MRIKLDENLPASLADELVALGHDADTAPGEGLAGHDDPDIWRAAQGPGRFLVTQDLDFSDLHAFEPGTHHGLLLVRLRNPSRHALVERIRAIFASEDVGSWHGSFVVATEHKIRIRRPATGPDTGE
jgi:predicted nuclease of predicted toxin-antitoxin system